MEPLVVKHRISNLIALVLGLLLLFSGIANLLFKPMPLKTIDWIGSLFNILIGAGAIYESIISYISRITVNENNLEIKWNSIMNSREATIAFLEIKMIVLGKSYIEIQKQDMSGFFMSFEWWRKKKKNKLYEFFTEFAKQKNLPLNIKYNLTN